jgi:hypothetical protein
MRASIDQLFINMKTPVVYEGNDRNSMDAVQYEIVGKVCLFLGGILSMGCLIPNAMNERLLFIGMGGMIVLLGLVLVALAKKSRLKSAL